MARQWFGRGIYLLDARMLKDKRSLVGLLDNLSEATKAEKISLDDLVQSVGDASFAPLLLIPSIAVATPLSGIPLFSSLMGMLIFLVAIQMLFRRDHLWLPKWLLQREMETARIRSNIERLHPFLTWLDNQSRARLSVLSHRPLVFIPQAVCVVSGLALPALEFVPFSSSIVGVAVALLALGMLARDGLIIALGLVPYAGLAWLLYRFF